MTYTVTAADGSTRVYTVNVSIAPSSSHDIADLTIMATEKVTRKTLDEADQRRLVEEALGELDFSGISSGSASAQ